MKARWWWVTVVVSLAVAAGTFVVGLKMGGGPPLAVEKTAAEILATVPLEMRRLTEEVVVRADVVALDSLTVNPPVVPDGSEPLVTTAAVEVGGEVSPGQLLVTVADRPVIALRGPVPMYREIRPQDSGSDVIQLQEAFVELGYALEVDGVFGRETEAAASDLYTSLGLELLHTGGEDQIDELEAALASARAGGDTAEIVRARRRLAEFEATVGGLIAKGEIAFLNAWPMRVLTLPRIGQTWTPDDETPALTLTGAELTMTTLVPTQFEELIGLGAHGQAELPSGESVGVAVSEIDPTPVVDEAGVRLRVTLKPDTPLDVSLNGQNLEVRLLAEGPAGEVLSAPISAVYTGASGRPHLIRPDGSRVPVELGSSAQGWVEIMEGKIEAGDPVVVGLEE